MIEKVATQQQQLQQQLQQQQEQQQRQQQLQQQLHRAHLELGAAHKRITENDELTATLEVRLEDMEFRRAENQKRQEREVAAVTVDLRDGKSFLSQVATGLSDLQQLARQQQQQQQKQQQQLSQVATDLSDLQQLAQQAPPPLPTATSSSFQDSDGPGQEDCAPGPLTPINQSTQTPGPHTPSAVVATLPDPGRTTLNISPSYQQQCGCGSSAATQSAPSRGTMPPADGASSAFRAFSSLGLTMVVGLIVLGGLGLPAALASTLVTPPPPTPEPEVGSQEWQDRLPPGSTGSGARGRPVSDVHTLRALSCQASTARLYPLETVCCVDPDSLSRPFSLVSPSQVIRRKAFLLQRHRTQKVDLWRCSKRTSSRSTHCGFQSWTSPEGFRDNVYEPTRVTPEECLQAIRQNLWTDPLGDIHQVSEGTNVLSFVSLGALDYRSSDGTWACRGGDRVNTAGNTEVSVLERQHIQFTITSLIGVYSTLDRSVQISPSIVLPSDRWSSAGTAIVEGDIFLRDQPGVPSPFCNLKLLRGPLEFIILAPEGDDNPYFVAVNVPSRIKVSYTKPEVPLLRECQHSIGQH